MQNLLADPDRDLTPSERQHYTDLIAIQNNIIADLAQEALDAGVTQTNLDAISAQAGTGVVNDAMIGNAIAFHLIDLLTSRPTTLSGNRAFAMLRIVLLILLCAQQELLVCG